MQTACWAMAKSWLDVQVDLELTHLEPGRLDQIRSFVDASDRNLGNSDTGFQPSNGPENWPLQVYNQQPRQLPDFLQKLHSGYIFNLVLALNFSSLMCCLINWSLYSFEIGKRCMKMLLEHARSSNDKLRYVLSKDEKWVKLSRVERLLWVVMLVDHWDQLYNCEIDCRQRALEKYAAQQWLCFFFLLIFCNFVCELHIMLSLVGCSQITMSI